MQILRSALGGDLWQQWQLLAIMMDTWPMLRSKSHELRDAVSQSKFKVEAFCIDGEEPTASASEKSALVKRAFQNFKPDQFTDEEDLTGGIYDFCDAMLNGLCVSEILWHTVKTKEFGIERYPRALCWVHPRHFTFTNDGKIAVFDDNYAREYYKMATQPTLTPDPRKFICSQFKSRSGSSLGAGLMRPLAYDWSAVMFNREWMLKSAQTFGSPFVDVTYKPGINQADLARLDAEIAAGLANRFIRHVEGTTVNVTAAKSASGQNNSQKDLMDMADKHCCELLVGQEGTTKSTPGQLGGKDDSKENTKRERIQGLASWVAKECLSQLARAILLVNYGNDQECPTIEPDFTEQESPMDAAKRMQILAMPNMPPMVADDYYSATKLTKPEVGDQVIMAGKIGQLGDTEQPIDPNPQPILSEHYDSNGNSMYPPDQGGQPEEEDDQQVEAGHRGTDLQKLLGRASSKDVAELESLVLAAEKAPHANGEITLVKAKLKQIGWKGTR